MWLCLGTPLAWRKGAVRPSCPLLDRGGERAKDATHDEKPLLGNADVFVVVRALAAFLEKLSSDIDLVVSTSMASEEAVHQLLGRGGRLAFPCTFGAPVCGSPLVRMGRIPRRQT